MQLFDLIPEDEKEKIWGYIRNYGGCGASYLSPQVDLEYLLRFWNTNKTYLNKVFGDKLILEKYVDIDCPETILWENMEEAMYPDGNSILFLQEYLNWVSTNYYQDYYGTYLGLQSLASLETLTTNIYNYDSFELSLPNQKRPLQINKGCKAIRMLSKIAKAFDIKGFEEFRLKHSMVLNQKKFQGTLCLSIHPLDYMTMSDNDYNWDSCMSWQKPGEYREGTVEMMNSTCVVVAYLKGENDMVIYREDGENYMWNNKRWRELFVVSPDLITHIKGYPYKDKILERELLAWLLELTAENTPEVQYITAPYSIGNYQTIKYGEEEAYISFDFTLMYDDFNEGHVCYINPELFQKKNKYGKVSIPVSGPTECLLCGQDCTNDSDNFDTEYLICCDCSGDMRCPECGDVNDRDDMQELADGSYLCRWCFERYGGACSCCEYLYHTSNMVTVNMYHRGETRLYDSILLCDDCFDSAAVKRDIGEIEYKARSNRLFGPKFYQANTKNFTDAGFEMFGFFGHEIEELRQELED